MPISFLTTAPLIVSVITNLTVEGIKKLLDGTKVKYSSNVLAAILSVLIACAVSVIYLLNIIKISRMNQIGIMNLTGLLLVIVINADFRIVRAAGFGDIAILRNRNIYSLIRFLIIGQQHQLLFGCGLHMYFFCLHKILFCPENFIAFRQTGQN